MGGRWKAVEDRLRSVVGDRPEVTFWHLRTGDENKRRIDSPGGSGETVGPATRGTPALERKKREGAFVDKGGYVPPNVAQASLLFHNLERSLMRICSSSPPPSWYWRGL